MMYMPLRRRWSDLPEGRQDRLVDRRILARRVEGIDEPVGISGR
jgi:hypothetical protein